MSKRILFFILFFNIGCDQEKYSRKFRKLEMHDRLVEAYFINDTILDGEAKYFTYTGYLESKYNYVNGKKNGVGINYYPNGNIYDSSYYKDGVKHGTHYVFDSLNTLIYQDYYFNGHMLGGKFFIEKKESINTLLKILRNKFYLKDYMIPQADLLAISAKY